MSQIFNALSRALRDLFKFKVFWIMVWPMLAASILWLLLGILFWSTFSEWISMGLTGIGVQNWLENLEPEWIAAGIQSIIHWILFIPLVMITSLIITAVFAMPALVNLVASSYYPGLEREQGGSISGSLVNVLIAVSIFSLIWFVTLPLWVLGLGVIVPFVAAAYLNQQLFRYDALSEHANREEIKALLVSDRLSLWSLGLLTGMVQFIPVLNLFAPVFAALAFIHFELACLKNIRSFSGVKINS